MNPDQNDSRFYLQLLALTLLGIGARVWLLAGQPVSFDDYSVALSAINYMESGQFGPTMWNHPVLRNILVYYSMKLFDSGLLGVKGWSLLFGTLCLPLVGLVGRRLLKNDRAALVAVFLWAVDLVAIDFSRQGINDIYLSFFPLLAIFCALRFIDTASERWLWGSGLAFGLGLASKISALFPLAATILLLMWALWRESAAELQLRLLRTLHLGAVLIVVPALVYLATFAPFFSRGYSLAEWGELQRNMFKETSQHTGYKEKEWMDRDNRAYKWFLVPGALFVDVFTNMDVNGKDLPLNEWRVEDNVTVILGVANPLVWLLVLPAAFSVAWRGYRRKNPELCFLAALFFFTYLPLVLTGRPIWVNTALTVLPFALMAVAFLVVSWAEQRANRFALRAYLGAVGVCALLLYPLAIGKGLKTPLLRDYVKQRILDTMRQPESSPAAPVGMPAPK